MRFNNEWRLLTRASFKRKAKRKKLLRHIEHPKISKINPSQVEVLGIKRPQKKKESLSSLAVASRIEETSLSLSSRAVQTRRRFLVVGVSIEKSFTRDCIIFRIES
jgi:hypothetical protein